MKKKEREVRLDTVQKTIEEYRKKLDELEKQIKQSFEQSLKRRKPEK